MFSSELFRSWLFILISGACFAAFFGAIVLMSETLFFEASGLSSTVKGIAGLSFLGYVGVAWLIRTET
jgi:hypothetical protein